LQRFFGYYGVLNADTAKEVWDLTQEKLSHPDMGVRGLIKMSNVAFVGTTDDPIDSLEWHEKLAADPTFDTVVAPSFRPDKALNAEKPGFLAYIEKLACVTGIEIHDLKSLKAALRDRIEYFHLHGCKASDHGLDTMVWAPGNAQMVLQKALAGDTVTVQEAEVLKTDLLLFCAKEYHRLGWVMQLHYNCIRNPNAKMFGKLGPDTGYDVIGPAPSGTKLTSLLSALYAEDALPKTILYSLDPKDNEMLDTIIGAFGGDGIPGKMQHGSAWWFNDYRQGMIDQLTSLANLNLLGNFVGMLTDSRSFLSYTRHEYFRRILCNLIGKWVENGEYPADMEAVGGIVRDIAFNNAKRYFGLEV
jgi:glucuronate isomerase